MRDHKALRKMAAEHQSAIEKKLNIGVFNTHWWNTRKARIAREVKKREEIAKLKSKERKK